MGGAHARPWLRSEMPGGGGIVDRILSGGLLGGDKDSVDSSPPRRPKDYVPSGAAPDGPDLHDFLPQRETEYYVQEENQVKRDGVTKRGSES